MDLYGSVGQIKGIGPKKLNILSKLGINTISDMLYYFPRTYQNRTIITKIKDINLPGDVLVKANIKLITKNNNFRSRKQTLKLLIGDDTGILEVVFFNAKYVEKSLSMGEEYSFYGKITISNGKIQMIHPEFTKENNEDLQGIIPVYSLVSGITQNEIRKWIKKSLECIYMEKDHLSDELLYNKRLCKIDYALYNIHKPEDIQKLKIAKYRLIFDELLIFQLGLFKIKNSGNQLEFNYKIIKLGETDNFIKSLPFNLTDAQKKVAKEVIKDMESEKPMNRLIQGDVGSGKTVIAEIAIYKAVRSGYQAAMMAPTEILAKQHFKGLEAIFTPHGIKVGILCGSMTAKDKKETLLSLYSGEIDVIVGTHAIIQDKVSFRKLGLVITDEQHRFGVNQRRMFADKGEGVDKLVMTATPIPRTLAVIIYGDLDISVINELPPGRKNIITNSVSTKNRDAAYKFIQAEIEKGHQAYVVTPLIEESENLDLLSSVEVYNELKAKWKNVSTGLIHGEMKQSEKDIVMLDFYEGKIQILVATVVIEVGINVPNATVMIIENAERFGLAQLHQLRGRVGRGGDQSYCTLVTNSNSEIAKERQNIMVSSSDGFEIAEKDLELRGPGEFFGLRQHGLPNLRIADVVKHLKILMEARLVANEILEIDPNMNNKENQLLNNKVKKMYKELDSFDITL